MQLRQLQYFVAVAEQLNFRKAAELLYVTQPLLSKQIADLEEEVGYPLFIRTTRSVSLTPAGEVMLEEANKLIRQSNLLLYSVQKAAKFGNEYGTLRVGYEESISQVMMGELFNRLRTEYPGIDVLFSRHTSNEMDTAIQNNTIDMGFIWLPQKYVGNNTDCRILSCDSLCLATSAKLLPETATIEDYIRLSNDIPICLLEKNAKGLNLISTLCQQMNVYTDFIFAQSIQDMLICAESGYGISIMPYSFFQYHNHSLLNACQIKMPDAELCMAAIWNHDTSCVPRDRLLKICSNRHVECNLCSKFWCFQKKNL